MAVIKTNELHKQCVHINTQDIPKKGKGLWPDNMTCIYLHNCFSLFETIHVL